MWNWLKETYFLPFKLLAKGVALYQINRRFFAEQFAKKRVAALMKFLIVLTFGAWIVVWLFAGEEYRGRLTEAVRSYLSPNE
jgi:hypothetical protein